LQFSLQTASPETFGYTLVWRIRKAKHKELFVRNVTNSGFDRLRLDVYAFFAKERLK
jgi:hypothetical protein